MIDNRGNKKEKHKKKVSLRSTLTGKSVFFERLVQTTDNTEFLMLRFLHILNI